MIDIELIDYEFTFLNSEGFVNEYKVDIFVANL